MKNLKILEYKDEFKEQIIGFLIDVAIGEFKFVSWYNYLKNKDFEPYKIKTSKFWFVLNEDNEVVATCGGLKKDNETIKLNSFYVKKEYRQNGIGKTLYKLFCDYATELNYKYIILCAHKENDIAIKFYEKQGFYLDIVEDEELWYKKKI